MMTTAPAQERSGRSARQRLLDAADELFYDEGVHTVGIDRIIERAGVAKASLYNSFAGKEELIEAYLDTRHAGTMARLTDAVQQHTDPVARVYAIFDAQAEMLAQPNFRGCAFISASRSRPSARLPPRVKGVKNCAPPPNITSRPRGPSAPL